jgi:hypothetical protein
MEDTTDRRTMKNADEKLADTVEFLSNARRAITQLEEVERLLRENEEFRNLWNTDSAAALRQVGIDPDARVEMGLPPYPPKGDDEGGGARCDWCLTPTGKACHC